MSTPGDLLFHIRHDRMDLCFEFATQAMSRLAGAATVVDEVHGFRYFDERDLLGFVDGTENPVGARGRGRRPGRRRPTRRSPAAATSSCRSTCTTWTAWNALSTEDQEKAIGRYKLSDIEMPDDVKPANSHVALNTIEEPDGTQRQILRANMPFGELGRGEFGTYYIAYAATPSVTEQMLSNMFIGDPPGNTDRILDFSTAVTGGLFFAPSADFLDDLPGPPGDPAGPRRRPAYPGPRTRSGGAAAEDGSLGIGSLKRSTSHEQPVPRARSDLRCRLGEHRGRGPPDVRAERGRPPGGGRPGTRRPQRWPAWTPATWPRSSRPAATPPGSSPGCAARSSWSSSGCRSRVSRLDVDNVERGAQDSDWQPVKDAAKQIAFAEDRAIFEGYPAAGITGVRPSTSNPVLTLPAEAREYPAVVSQAVSALRLAGVGGPYSLLLSAPAYTMVSETSDHGYPIREHLARVVDGEIIWAPAIDGAFLLSARGGDYELRLGQDLSIGYLSHDSEYVQLYFQESLTFLAYTAEASVALNAP